MVFRAIVVSAALLVSASAAYARDARSEAKSQVEFGIRMAQNQLWKEAAYRWQKAVDIDPTYAAAWNNLAIAYEQQGDFEKRGQGVRESGRDSSRTT